MRHLVIGQHQKAPNFSAFHWSPHGCLITIGQHFVTTRVVHLPKRTETSLITKSDQAELITSYCRYAWSAQPGLTRTRLCGPCIAAKAGCDTDFKTMHLHQLFQVICSQSTTQLVQCKIGATEKNAMRFP